MEFLIAIAILSAIGIILGIVLAIVSIVLAVPTNEKVAAIEEVLPGANCGACGFSGCSGYAEGIVKGAPINLCSPGGEDVIEAIGALTGQSAALEKKTAFVHCNGTCDNTKPRMEYDGIKSCTSANNLGGGPGSCSHGCIGFGDCVKVCEYNAIFIQDGVAVVDPSKCTSCTCCVGACPKGLIDIIKVPKNNRKVAQVLCTNKDKAPLSAKVCSVSCIGCSKCKSVCPKDCITIENNLSKIDADKCIGCGKCVTVCPKNCILMLDFKKALETT